MSRSERVSKRARRGRRFAIEDPHSEREAERYERPIPSREALLAYLDELGEPVAAGELARALGLTEERDREALRRRLQAMERDGQLVRNRRKAYGLAQRMGLVRGRVIGHGDGFGFLVPDGGGEDLFLSPREMRTLMHGDRALVRIAGHDRRGRPEAALVEVLERANRQVVGRYFADGGVGYVVPDNARIAHEILVPESGRKGARSGQIVVAEIDEYPRGARQAHGRVVEVLGDHLAPGMEIDVAARVHQLPSTWSEEASAEAARFSATVPESAKRGRRDLRELPLVTIDGADAKDFDDAVWCERRARGWRLVVAIADVAAYVKPGSALDAAARERGTSVYFPGRVIPMLPEVLSNGLCSLNPDVDRLCLACELLIDAEGRVTRSSFHRALMRSAARLTYDQVAGALVEREPGARAALGELLPHLKALYGLFKVLRAARERRGAIDFDATETKIEFDAAGKIERILPLRRNDAHLIIEECMILANVAAARYLQRQRIPLLYRVHEEPDSEKITELRGFLLEFGLRLQGGEKPAPKDFARLLRQVSGRPDAHLIETVMLRSLNQALYSPGNCGHFGLAHEAYAHFTSPIRRYPDLVVHRAIHHVLDGKSPDRFPYAADEMVMLGEHCSATERRADEAVRDAVNWLRCEYMMDRVGEEFDGVISGVSGFGLFVELNEIHAQGLVHVTALENDYYHLDAAKHRLVGERGGRVYRLSDPVRVRVVRVDLDERKIDLELVGERRAGGKARARGGRRR